MADETAVDEIAVDEPGPHRCFVFSVWNETETDD